MSVGECSTLTPDLTPALRRILSEIIVSLNEATRLERRGLDLEEATGLFFSDLSEGPFTRSLVSYR